MGLFDFWKDKGDDVIESPEKAAGDIKRHVESADVAVEDLQVAYNDGVVEMSGKAGSSEDMERAVIAAGNIKGVEEVKADGLRAPAADPAAEAEFYTIESGDTLSAIAKRYYGDAMQYPKIFEANRGIISDPNKIYPGQKIRIPKA
jgi:nucleoid-associated protein YgaU